jgi:hypothetical protein
MQQICDIRRKACMNVKTNAIPVILWATGTFSKSFRKYLTTVYLLGRHEIKELEKTAILVTAHIL